MKLGLQIPYFTWDGGESVLGPRLAEISRTAESAGYDSIWVMDHYFQIPMMGKVEENMLEAYTTLGYIAAHTTRVGVGTLITGVTYRHHGILIKQVTTLDVLSGGRAWLGIGAAWFEREHIGLGVPFPPLKERFERLEEAIQIGNQMWSDDNDGPFQGKYYQLAETLNLPQSISRPRPRLMIGGGGEKKTLRFVARYADACNFPGFDVASVRHKLDVLRQHCEAEGRNYDEILKTATVWSDVGPNREQAGQLVETLGRLAECGVQMALGRLVGVEDIKPLEAIGKDVIPQIVNL